jgi:hypothetical protein
MGKRNIRLPVAITVRQESGSDTHSYHLGTVEPPKINGIPVFHDGEEYRGKRAGGGRPMNIHEALDELWDEWMDSFKGEDGRMVDGPDTDSEFVDWLIAEKRWTRFSDVITHEIVT